MLKLEIKLDEEKIKEDQLFTPDEIYRKLDRMFAEWDLPKEVLPDGTLFYFGKGKSQDYGAFGRLITTLKRKEWFMDYVIKWIWYNSDDTWRDDIFAVEDVLYYYTQERSEGYCTLIQ